MTDIEFSRFDRDPEALEWARGKVQHTVDKFRRFEQQARDRGTFDGDNQWRKFANLLEMELIGGEGCVITGFDSRLPEIVRAWEAPTPPEFR